MLIKYVGLFITDEFKSILHTKSPILHENIINNPHVTIDYKPKQISYYKLIGETHEIEITGVGNNADNQGFKVNLPPEIIKIYNGSRLPHITVSLNNNAEAVNTWKLNFKEIDSFKVLGRLGLSTDKGILYKLTSL
ncbi:hypothetical protein [Paenibacillus sp. Root444D2]|uniref:hypothetical protein n=1 Tax=Paenibacillus sp. Root444D2 TaxID=1736538 RepID=UPI00070FCF06|nr:hypothetical protein [Paenibacillus sp. Root444D2]KQX68465.1 hypothetical protein ASD40_23535 [Paenibacillus sp. Root444D2]